MPTTPNIQILQGCDGCDDIEGPPGPGGTSGRDGNNRKLDVQNQQSSPESGNLSSLKRNKIVMLCTKYVL